MNKQELEDQVIELQEMLRISNEQGNELSRQLDEFKSENENLKHELYSVSVKNSQLENNVIDFSEPFNAAEHSMSLMSGLRIEKVVTYTNEVNRIVREKLEEQTAQQRSSLTVTETALSKLRGY